MSALPAGGQRAVGDRIAAVHRFQRVLQIAPENPVARRELAKLTGR